ncbi:MAG TPA: hypothetical protein VFF59_13775 [Anaerolineae bacterium]|nr:hypothetical protein [Anaerolineae bacterium]
MTQAQGKAMRAPMTAVELTGMIDEPGESEWLYAAARNPAFAFLHEPQEDIYTLDDGQPFNDDQA